MGNLIFEHWSGPNLRSEVGSTLGDSVSLIAGAAAGAANANAVNGGHDNDSAAADGGGLAVLLLLAACSTILKAFSVISTA
mmetsp:Transcript_14739/g.26776  ORF Transcript_14739/g.26776 Transcript_14739/m.26776 type:complete len:81 (+) Transcript_14739:2823-3065(+)